MSKKRITIHTLVFVSLASFTLQANAYPVLLPAKQIQWMVGAKREHVIAITRKPDGKWEKIAIQSEEIEDDVAIVFRNPTESLPVRQKLRKPKTSDPFEGYFDNYHRFVINDNSMGVCNDKCDIEAKTAAKELCLGNSFSIYSRVVRVDVDFMKRTAFLVDCQEKQPAFANAQVSIDRKKHIMQGKDFKFKYTNEKSVMLDEFRVTERDTPVLTGTEMHVFLKPKFMFNMEFENKDVTAEISSLNHGPLSLGVEIATALNVFVFQVNKQICCDINIFEDSIYFPVMLDLPYSGDSFVKGSGLFYGFNVTEGTKFEYFPIDNRSQSQNSNSTRPARGATAMTLERENRVVTIGFGNLKGMDGTVLSPLQQNQSEMKEKGFSKIKNQSGIFYDATRLPDGFNHFNVWFYMGPVSEKERLLEYAKYGISFSARRVW